MKTLEIQKGTILISKKIKGLQVAFKSWVGTKNTEFRTMDDFQFRIEEFTILTENKI